MPDPTYDVFISHKSEYKPWVIWLAEMLQASGHSVFLDIWNLIPGESWVEGLHRGVQKCRAAVLVATPEVVNSGWVRNEYNALLSRREREPDFKLIPLVVGPLPDLPFLGTLQVVDFRNPNAYRAALHKLLCGLKGREPGADIALNFEAPPPPDLAPTTNARPVPSEQAFIENILRKVQPNGSPPLMVLSRGLRHQGAVIAQLSARAEQTYGRDKVLRLVPPFAPHASGEVFFRDLGRQCGATFDTPDSVSFLAALGQRLAEIGSQLLLIVGFENATPQHRRELALCMRSLCEREPTRLRIVLIGGGRLVEQKFAQADMSALNSATLLEWPDPSSADVAAWHQAASPITPLLPSEIDALLIRTGQHAGLVRHCLEQWDSRGEPARWDEWIYACPELWETWSHLARNEPDALRASLERTQLGPVVPWPMNPATRRLYWADLLRAEGGQLVWRTDTVRDIGREVLG